MHSVKPQLVVSISPKYASHVLKGLVGTTDSLLSAAVKDKDTLVPVDTSDAEHVRPV